MLSASIVETGSPNRRIRDINKWEINTPKMKGARERQMFCILFETILIQMI